MLTVERVANVAGEVLDLLSAIITIAQTDDGKDHLSEIRAIATSGASRAETIINLCDDAGAASARA
jgi:hypothetical protein